MPEHYASAASTVTRAVDGRLPRDPGQRRLRSALVVSLLLHVALLCNPVSLLAPRLNVGRPPLQVLVNSTGPGASAQPAADPRPAVSSTAVRAPRADTSAARTRSRPRLPADSGQQPGARLVAPSLSEERRQAAPDLPTHGDGIGAQGLSAQGLRDYRVALAVAARRFKRYPPVAREAVWEGPTEVAVIVSQWRPTAEVVLVRSSGRAVLDEEALSMLQQAAGATDLPDALRGKSFRVVLPVVFSLAGD